MTAAGMVRVVCSEGCVSAPAAGMGGEQQGPRQQQGAAPWKGWHALHFAACGTNAPHSAEGSDVGTAAVLPGVLPCWKGPGGSRVQRARPWQMPAADAARNPTAWRWCWYYLLPTLNMRGCCRA